ncbi:ribonuclease HII [Heyndrickxia sporothermodurans]|uniref:Ribonuclease HII n=1 Tax=Heyndrickxia sporothermodurans TaxID=46224 RepID=A0A150L7D6_9BACI|nr:ribonuclease HII [Heyndrickxia sporothermodurans]KYD08231.1 Ribonuclease HII [Heyndrickxia sporothermodurans]MBL5768911.1 ribonuclease HII [Heyndrickxia sporothermodurans]MBL5772064.1 ribonuclease HII [Heyndrickxia sporothermodurans]MBL5775650.1 ribonuclease HII [Heyndrickxia sporothermodurans]MBL5779203.1 ribonuclease HII [Heyndrickxia sporothermodurans]
MNTRTIKDIAEMLNKIVSKEDPLIKILEVDERKGVQNLLKQWYRQQELKENYRKKFNQMMKYEIDIKQQGFKYIAGIDEVGRGPLAGPVIAAAVILPDDFYLEGLNDSKQLSEKKRDEFYTIIMKEAVAVGTGVISAQEIDEVNIYEATKKAMIAAINDLQTMPDYCLIDAMKLTIPFPQTSIIKGDASSVSIAAASIVAKVTRDRLMKRYAQEYPNYLFDKNMGYGTNEHLQAIQKYGPCPIHRKTFAPIKNYM